MSEKPFDVVRFVMRFEAEAVDPNEVIDGFAHLVATGLAWQLQGSYGRYAEALINAGWIDGEGNVLDYPEPEFD